MYYINEESYSRVREAIEDIENGCEVMDDYREWEDIASSSISSVLEELDSEQYDMTCKAFIEWINEKECESRNFAYGVRAALIRAMDEGLDYYDLMGADDETENPVIAVMKRTKNAAEMLFREDE